MAKSRYCDLSEGFGCAIERGRQGETVTTIGILNGEIRIENARNGWKTKRRFDSAESVYILLGWAWLIPGLVVVSFQYDNTQEKILRFLVNDGFHALEPVPVAQLGLFAD